MLPDVFGKTGESFGIAVEAPLFPGERSAKDEQVDRGFQLDGRYNLSELAAVFKIAVRIDNLVECKNSVDDWL